MKVLAIDLETTGRYEDWCQILELGAILWDLSDGVTAGGEIARFNKRVWWPRIIGEPVALAMNAKLISEMPAFLDSSQLYLLHNQLWPVLNNWLSFQGVKEKLTLTGKNVGSFDRRFLVKLPDLDFEAHFHHRILDIGSLFFNPKIDKVLPDTRICVARAGLDPTKYVVHSAIDDCLLVCHCLEAYYARNRS
jgi:oligoribonuclease (3'-5' exoribonuclease)